MIAFYIKDTIEEEESIVLTFKGVKPGLTLVEVLITLALFSIVMISVTNLYTESNRYTNQLLKRTDAFSELFTVENVLQIELTKAGPDIRYIALVKEAGSEDYKAIRYSVFIPMTNYKITKQLYFKDGKIKVWEKEFNVSDFPSKPENTLTVPTLEPSDVNIVFSTTEFENIDIKFTGVGTQKVEYTITLDTGGGTTLTHDSIVFLLNME